jgi:penicillin amidase
MGAAMVSLYEEFSMKKWPRLRKWAIRVLIFFVLADLIVLLAGVWLYWQSRTPTEGKVSVKGLIGKVTVTRDTYGVPHIIAEKSDRDAFFALGYVHAQDRLWQMEFNRRVAQGTLSEVLGDKTIEADKYLRTWGFYAAAKASWPFLSPQTQAIVQAYTDGVNAFIAQGHFPLQFSLLGYKPAPWTVTDTLAWQKLLAWDLQDIWKGKLKNYLIEKSMGKAKIAEVFPPYPENGPLILSDADLKQSGLWQAAGILPETFANSPGKGSNNWVVSGKLTETGKPLLANDPHLELQSPALWYLAEMKGPHLHVIGATMPGMPGVVIGHNDHIAWGVTNVNPDTQDVYILPKSAKITVKQEVIKVKNHPDVIWPVRQSEAGPIMSQVSEMGQVGPNVALKWTALADDDTTIQSMLEIDYAEDWKTFVDALKDFTAPSQNFVYADIQGNIGYYLPGRIPLRTWDASLPVPYDAAHQWQGFIPFDKLPHVFNPPEGLIVSANNQVVSRHYPYAINFRWSVPPYRAARILHLLKENEPLTAEKFKRIQYDTFSSLWSSLSPELLKTTPLDNQSKVALDYLNRWNGDVSLDSVAATIFAYWYQQLGEKMPEVIKGLIRFPEPLYIQQQIKDHPEMRSKSLSLAMQTLVKEKGKDPQKWQWGDVHRVVFAELGLGVVPGINLFWNRSIPTPGDLYTINVGTYNFKTFQQEDGAGFREIIDFNDLNQSVYIQSLGQSNDPLNRNYQDQMRLWRDGKYLSMSEDPKAWGEKRTLVFLPTSSVG